jgi:hypothetical protein
VKFWRNGISFHAVILIYGAGKVNQNASQNMGKCKDSLPEEVETPKKWKKEKDLPIKSLQMADNGAMMAQMRKAVFLCRRKKLSGMSSSVKPVMPPSC